MEVEAVQAWFTPYHYITYLFIILVLMIVYYQWRWAKDCRENVLVLVSKAAGGSTKHLVSKQGGSVALKDPKSDTIRMWPINKLSVIDMPYPGVAFVPWFMQKEIKMAILDEDEWEPMINKNPYMERVMSPDVVEALTALGEEYPDARPTIVAMLENVQTAPTRAMIASPAVLGNLMHEKITEAIITVNKEMLDNIASLMKRLTKITTPVQLYVCTALVLAGIIFVAVQAMSAVDVSADVDAIKQALGIP